MTFRNLTLIVLLLSTSPCVAVAEDASDSIKLQVIKAQYPYVYSAVSDKRLPLLKGSVLSVVSSEGKDVIVLSIESWVDLRDYCDDEIIVYRENQFIGFVKSVDCNKNGL